VSNAGGDKLAPPPEAPAPQALRAPPAPAPTPPVAAAVPLPAPVATAPKPAVEKPVAAAAEKHPMATPAGRNTLVQLAAVRTEEAAKSEWQRLSHRMPDLLGQRAPAISKVDHDGTTLWRLRTGGFSDTAQANAFCEKVRAKGSGCSVAEF